MAKLFVLMGIPGSGKSTFVTKHIDTTNEVHISRDKIRFSLLEDGDAYFSKEKKVFKTFTKEINEALKKGFNVYADATHLNAVSRNKLLRAVTVKGIEINCIWVKTPLKEALKRNENRYGSRSYVPKNTIRDMYRDMKKPEFYEGFNKIYIITPDKPIEILTKEE